MSCIKPLGIKSMTKEEKADLARTLLAVINEQNEKVRPDEPSVIEVIDSDSESNSLEIVDPVINSPMFDEIKKEKDDNIGKREGSNDDAKHHDVATKAEPEEVIIDAEAFYDSEDDAEYLGVLEGDSDSDIEVDVGSTETGTNTTNTMNSEPYQEEISNDFEDIISLSDDEDESMEEEEHTKYIHCLGSNMQKQHHVQLANEIPQELRSADHTFNSLIYFFCPDCNTGCGTYKKWRTHLEMHHNLRSLHNLNMQTINDNNGDTFFQCKNCSKMFKSSLIYSTALYHYITHLPNSRYLKCRLCKERYRERKHLINHLKESHSKTCERFLNQYADHKGYINCYCPICKTQLPDRKQWKNHLHDIHDFNQNLDQQYTISNDRYLCRVCDLCVAKRSKFKHALDHQKFMSFECNICKKMENNNYHMVLHHIRQIHYCGLIKSKCSYCNKTFDSPAQRNKHVRELHNYTLVSCSVCKKSFKNGASLLKHMHWDKHLEL